MNTADDLRIWGLRVSVTAKGTKRSQCIAPPSETNRRLTLASEGKSMEGDGSWKAVWMVMDYSHVN